MRTRLPVPTDKAADTISNIANASDTIITNTSDTTSLLRSKPVRFLEGTEQGAAMLSTLRKGATARPGWALHARNSSFIRNVLDQVKKDMEKSAQDESVGALCQRRAICHL